MIHQSYFNNREYIRLLHDRPWWLSQLARFHSILCSTIDSQVEGLNPSTSISIFGVKSIIKVEFCGQE